MILPLVLCLILQLFSVPALAAPLQATVEADRTLEQWQHDVLPTIVKGRIWTDAMLPREHTNEEWFRVPIWKAGEIQGDVATEYEIKDGQRRLLGIHKNRFDLLVGQQQDVQGGIWHCARFPNVSTVEGDDQITAVIGLDSSHSQPSPDQEIVQEHSIEIARLKDSGKIVSVSERLTSSSWSPRDGDSLLLIQQTLGANGQPVKEGRVIVRRVAWFRRLDSLPDGYNLRESFKRFLLYHGFANLVPL